jgi:hypothetical protein
MTIYINNLLSATEANVTGKPTPTRTWQWLRNGTAISGANSSTYTVIEADLAANLSVSQIETNLGGVDKATSIAIGPVSLFGVNYLFANDEEGAWYDPSDLSTLFQDSAGTTPVTTAGQPVGLMLDKSQGLVLGTEEITNNDFATSDLTGWSTATQGDGSVSVVGGQAVFSSTKNYSTDRSAIYQSHNLSAGTYVVEGDIISKDTSFFWIIIGPAYGAGNISGNNYSPEVGRFSRKITVPTDGNVWFEFRVSGSLVLDNVSVKKLAGNHATQATSAARPTYQTAGGLHWLAFDGVDDYMDGAGGWAVDDTLTLMLGGKTTSSTNNAGYIVVNPGSAINYTQRAIGLADASTLKVDTRSFDVNVTYDLSTAGVLEGVFTSNQVKAAINGGDFVVGNRTVENTTTDFVVGKGLTGIELPCDIYGIFIINRDLNSIERSNLVSYFAEKSGVTL